MKQQALFIVATGLLAGLTSCSESTPERPNILLCVGDDITWKHMGAYGCTWTKTPSFDRVAEQGVLFNNAFTCNAKCAPSRASILTGRNSWQLEEAANHMYYFREKFKTFTEVLSENGYYTGFTGKGLVPAVVLPVNGVERKVLGQNFSSLRMNTPATEISDIDYAGNFKQFLDRKPQDKPFCFWYGSNEPHRGYTFRSSIEKGNYSLDADFDIPDFWPQDDTVKTDMLDYAFELEWFDMHLGQMLQLLEERGELANTLVIVLADNGMPFPRAKGQSYEYSNHLPLAIMWPNGIKHKGRKIDDYVTYSDLAPTILEVTGIDISTCNMQPIQGKSITGILYSKKQGIIEPDRNFALIGKERHDVGRPNDVGYPIRGIRKGDYLYVRNFETTRWPAGDPITGYLNCDASPTKTQILRSRTTPGMELYWKTNFGKRPTEELYNITNDEECMVNLANEPEMASVKQELWKLLEDELKAQGDPRMFGNGNIFDEYEVAFKNVKDFYNRYMAGEKMVAGWVIESDFEQITD